VITGGGHVGSCLRDVGQEIRLDLNSLTVIIIYLHTLHNLSSCNRVLLHFKNPVD